jgi:hypothetical protein
MKSLLYLTTALSFTYLISPVQSQTPDSTQCTYWLFAAQSSDLDSSGSLSQDEYFAFLTSIDDPTHVGEYFVQYENFANLPWEYKVIYKTMACNCMRMGQSSDCCVGENAMVALPTMTSPQVRQSTDAAMYQEELLCQQIAFLVGTVEAPPTLSPILTPDVLTGDDAVSPTPAPQSADEAKGVIVEDGSNYQQDSETNSTLGAGAIVGILFAIFVPLCGGCFVLARQRKMAEEKRLREFAGEAVKEDHLASFDAMNDKREALPKAEELEDSKLQSEEEIAVIPPIQQTKEDDNSKVNDESDEDSVWSDGDKKDEKDIIVDTKEDAPQSTVGSALAAMGVASTVATSIISPINKKEEEEDTTKINAFV